MLQPDKHNDERFESRMATDQGNARRSLIGAVVILLLLGLFVGGGLALDGWLASEDARSTAFKGAAWIVALAITTAATMAGSSRRCSGRCWLRNLSQRVKRARATHAGAAISHLDRLHRP